MVDKVVGAVVGNVIGKAMGGGSRAPSTQQEKIPGVEFQPVTYTGASGAVTGAPTGDYGYDWSTELPDWLNMLGAAGQGAVGNLFTDYYNQVQQDPYAVGQEFYNRGVAQLQPEFMKQQIQAQERMFGGGRLGLKLAGAGVGAPTGTGAVSPDAFGLGAAQANTLQDLWTNSLTAGQSLQTNRLNQLSQASQGALNLSMLPMKTEQDLINFVKNLEIARSNALKAGTQNVSLTETPQSVFAGQLANTVGTGVSNWMSQGDMGLPTSYSSGSPWMSASNQTWGANMGNSVYNPNAGGSLFSPF